MKKKYRKYVHFLFYIFFAALIGYAIYSFINFYFKPNKLVELNVKNIVLYVGDAYPLQGEYKNKKIVYSINNSDVADIDRDTGVVIAKKTGKATLFARVEDDNSIYSEANIKVVGQNNDQIIINDSKLSLTVDDQRNANVSIGKKSPSRVKYRSKNPGVVTVNDDGVIKAVGDGTTKIEVILDDNDDNPQVIDVNVNPVPSNPEKEDDNGNKKTGTTVTKTPSSPTSSYNVTSVSLNKSYLNMTVGQSDKLVATVNPVLAKNKKVSWTTSNKKVATVDSNGNVKAVSAGSAVITVVTNDGNKTAICKVTVTKADAGILVEKINFNRSNYVLTSGGSEQINNSVVPSNATDKSLTWSSSNNNVVKVDGNGKITGVSAGTATITAKSKNGIVKTANVKVYQSGLAVADTYYPTDQYIVYTHNVLEYGANPYGEGDSTNAFKNAIKDANNCVTQSSCNGYTIFVPAGRYIIKDSLDLGPAVGLIGDLKEGTTSGTILQIEHGAGINNYNNGAIKMDTQSALMNIAFWYPNQSANGNGYTTLYSPTIVQTSNYGITIKNVNFVNSYTAMDFASSHFDLSLASVSDVYGSPLYGIVADGVFDVPRFTNVNFNANYWLNSGLSNIPSAANVKAALKARGEGLILERIDWYFLTGIKLDGYNVGIRLRNSTHHVKNTTQTTLDGDGEMFDIQITNTNIPMYIQSTRIFTLTNATLSSSSSAAAMHIDNSDRISINSATISGSSAITNNGPEKISITNSVIKGTINRKSANNKYAFTNTNLTNTNYNGSSVNLDVGKGASAINYNKKVTTKPKSSKLVVINAAKYSDITAQLKNAINSLKSTGGIVYIPAGDYTVSDHIEVYSGIEIRGTTPWYHTWFQKNNTTQKTYEFATRITTRYKGNVLFILNSNSGINGLTILYNDQNLTEYPFTIRGNGSNIFIKNVALPDSWQGIDLATNRCDNHYVDAISGQFYKVGIRVGAGSANGIVKNCHFQILETNTLSLVRKFNAQTFANHFNYINNNNVAYELGNSSNELFFNNFVYSGRIGFNIVSGASNFTLLGCGADAMGWVSHHVSGSVNGQIVNNIFEPMAGSGHYCYRYNGSGCLAQPNNAADRRYLKFGDSYSGYVNVVNSISWGNGNDSTAFEFGGNGDIHINGGIIHTTASPVIRNKGAALSVLGLLIGQNSSTVYEINKGAKAFGIINNVCDFGNCSNRIANNAGINIGINNGGIK